MKILTNVFSPVMRLKEEVSLEGGPLPLSEILVKLRNRPGGGWERMIKDDLSLEKGCVILVNGRNIGSLQNLETTIHDGDELTFTVLVAGG
jgi:molybdopterin converting factor small subunit